jgi:cytochrome c oxidase subunit 2
VGVSLSQLGIVTANELHIPLSTDESARPSYLKLLSVDVNHTFWIPNSAARQI